MANRSNILAQKLQGYLDGTTVVERDDCAADIAHVCALVEEGMTALEATSGDANRAFNTTSNSNGNDQVPCKFGDDCFARDCKWRHSKNHDPTAAWKREENQRAKANGDKGSKAGKGGGKHSRGGKGGHGKQRCKQPGCHEHQKHAYCNTHYRQLQEQNTAKTSRKEKRAAKADVKTEFKRAAKVTKAELLQDMLLKARESRKQYLLKRSRAHDVVASSDDEEPVSVFDRIRSNTGAPKCVKAARREKKAKVETIADLLLSDDDFE